MDCGAVGTDCTVVRVGLVVGIVGSGGETAVRGTERYGLWCGWYRLYGGACGTGSGYCG